MPELKRGADVLSGRLDLMFDRFSKLLGHRKTEIEVFGIEKIMMDHLSDHGIGADDKPLEYSLTICGFDDAVQLCLDDEPDPDIDRRNYIGLFFTGDTFSEDLGQELETIERSRPGLGRGLLRMLDDSPCNIMTPFGIWENADWFFNWEWHRGQWHCIEDDLDEDIITPEAFKAYYPEWAYVRTDDPMPDLSPWPQLENLLCTAARFSADGSRLARRKYMRGFITPDGAEMFSGCVAWTKGRNEVERDIGYIACDNVYYQLQHMNGACPGCMQFEFILNDANAERNRMMVKLLDDFLDHLTALERVIDDILKGVFR